MLCMQMTTLETLVDWWQREFNWCVQEYTRHVSKPGLLDFNTPELKSLSRAHPIGQRVLRLATAVYTAKKNGSCTWKRSTAEPEWAHLQEQCPLWTKLSLVVS